MPSAGPQLSPLIMLTSSLAMRFLSTLSFTTVSLRDIALVGSIADWSVRAVARRGEAGPKVLDSFWLQGWLAGYIIHVHVTTNIAPPADSVIYCHLPCALPISTAQLPVAPSGPVTSWPACPAFSTQPWGTQGGGHRAQEQGQRSLQDPGLCHRIGLL